MGAAEVGSAQVPSCPARALSAGTQLPGVCPFRVRSLTPPTTLLFLTLWEVCTCGLLRRVKQPGHLLLLLSLAQGIRSPISCCPAEESSPVVEGTSGRRGGYKCSGGEASSRWGLRDTGTCCVWEAGFVLAGGRNKNPFCSPSLP